MPSHCHVSWQHCYWWRCGKPCQPASWTSQWQCKDGHSSSDKHKYGTVFCHLSFFVVVVVVLSSDGVKPAENHWLMKVQFSDSSPLNWPAVKFRQYGFLSAGVLLQHDSDKLPCCPRNSWNHYGPALQPSNIFRISHICQISPCMITVFLEYSETMHRKTFRSEERGGTWVTAHLIKRFFFLYGYPCTCNSWRTCIKCNGDYTENWCSNMTFLCQ